MAGVTKKTANKQDVQEKKPELEPGVDQRVGSEAGEVIAAGDGSDDGADGVAGDGSAADADGDAGDGSAAGVDGYAGDGSATGADASAGMISSESWYTVQLIRSPVVQRIRAGFTFTSTPQPLDFATLTDEQREKIVTDPYLRIKPHTPAGE